MSTTYDLIGQREQRLEKIEQLKKLGIEAYPAKSKRSNALKEIKNNFADFENKTVTLAGRLMSWREHGEIIFANIEDQDARLQVFIRSSELSPTNAKTQSLGFVDLKLVDVGDFIEVTGTIVKTKTGEISIIPTILRILTKAIRPLPDKWKGITDKELRYRRRYLDLTMNEENRQRFIRKAQFWAKTREYLQSQGFIEVETPVLEHKTGGADARPFITHHNDEDIDLYMRISSELFQKRLIGGGFEKIFTLGPNFRNEGIDDEHLQEYYQVEWYWAYANYLDNMELVKNVLRYVAKEVYGTTKFSTRGHTFDLADEWKVIDYVEIIKEKLGIDIFTSTDAEMLAVIKEKNVKLSGDINRSRLIDNLWKVIRKTISGPAFLLNEPKFMSPLAKSRIDKPELTERFHIIIGGSELGNGYSELNDPIDQLERFREQESARIAGDAESQMLDIDYVEMLEFGMPPTSGYAHSERVFWFFEDVSAREGTLFPLMREEIDPLTRKIYGMENVVSNSAKQQDFSKKFVIVVDKELAGWQLTNTIGHISAYLGNKVDKEQFLSQPKFALAGDVTTPANSQYPVVTLVADKKELRKFNAILAKEKYPYLTYVQEMTETSDDAKLSKMLAEQKMEDLKILGIGIFGDKDELAKLTKNFSLFK
jgi:lysyl-tRNA synthetase class 2